jgi:hypothetical protein
MQKQEATSRTSGSLLVITFMVLVDDIRLFSLISAVVDKVRNSISAADLNLFVRSGPYPSFQSSRFQT